MPCFLFTYHVHGTWLPDRKQGYGKRGQGILPPDERMHRLYAGAMRQPVVSLNNAQQRCVISVLLESAPLQRLEVYSVATDRTHIHVLLGWRDEREPAKLRSLVKGSLTRRLMQHFGHRDWFAEGGSRKQVRSREHFEYLTTTYLPKHVGWKWNRAEGFYT